MAMHVFEFYLRVLIVSLTSVSTANKCEILSAWEDKFVSPSGHVMFCLLYKYWWNVPIKNNFFKFIFKMAKKWSLNLTNNLQKNLKLEAILKSVVGVSPILTCFGLLVALTCMRHRMEK